MSSDLSPVFRTTTQVVAGRKGFVLLEVLVSLMIASAFLSLILPTASQSYERVRSAQRLNEAVQLASTELEELSAGTQTGAFPRSGQSGDLTWTIARVAIESGEPLSSAGSPSLCTYQVSVTERGNRNPLLQFAVQRLHFD